MYSQLKIFLFLLTRKQPEPPYSVLGLQNQAAASEDHQNLVQLGHHAGRRRAAGRQAPLRYSTMQNLRPYHHHRVLHAVNTTIITDKIGPHARTLPPSAPLSLRLLTKISDSVGDGDFLLCSVTGEGTTVAEVEVS